jgi:hypothetical protein
MEIRGRGKNVVSNRGNGKKKLTIVPKKVIFPSKCQNNVIFF